MGVAKGTKELVKHCEADARYYGPHEGQPYGAMRHLPRQRFAEDDKLTREQVLAILEMAPGTILDALEAAAVPDQDWCEAEKLALDTFEAIERKKQDEPTVPIEADTYNHRHFLEQHGPFQVRRLPNGGVMLVTHPYRYLWPLWSRALDLLGIRPLKA